ncbi:MAG TPA: urea ABC transporter permease subunit UrtC [Polyangiaceae bacterium]|nr:urea ABC transporter permease subunit UrtC [Polyangiaceae bacterium]
MTAPNPIANSSEHQSPDDRSTTDLASEPAPHSSPVPTRDAPSAAARESSSVPRSGLVGSAARAERLEPVMSPRQWLSWAIALVVGAVLIPILNSLPADSALHLPDYLVTLFGKFCCYATVALAMDLLWGYTGILSLGHGVFFALGGYAMGMCLMLGIGAAGVYRSNLPDFMVFLDWKELPWFWRPFDNFWFAMFAALAAPGLLAYAFGFFAFRSRIRGVYFSIITQALTFAMMLLFFRNETGLGGNNGLTDFKQIYGYPLQKGSTKLALYMLSCASVFVTFAICRFVTTSKAGRVLRSIRDEENRVMFLGYDPTRFKLFAYTLSAVLCGLAGALYVPQVGIINPGELQPSNSIEMAIWVAVGGRGSLLGAPLGAFVVNGAKSIFTSLMPEAWLYMLGLLFVSVTLFFPQGLLGVLSRLKK